MSSILANAVENPAPTQDKYTNRPCINLLSASPKVAEAGLETYDESSGKATESESGGAESGAVDARNAPIDPDLRTIIERWAGLSEEVRVSILKLATEAE